MAFPLLIFRRYCRVCKSDSVPDALSISVIEMIEAIEPGQFRAIRHEGPERRIFKSSI